MRIPTPSRSTLTTHRRTTRWEAATEQEHMHMTGEAQGSGRCFSGIAQASCTHPLEDSLRQGTTSLATRCAGKRHTHRAQALRAHPMEDCFPVFAKQSTILHTWGSHLTLVPRTPTVQCCQPRPLLVRADGTLFRSVRAGARRGGANIASPGGGGAAGAGVMRSGTLFRKHRTLWCMRRGDPCAGVAMHVHEY